MVEYVSRVGIQSIWGNLVILAAVCQGCDLGWVHGSCSHVLRLGGVGSVAQ